MSENKVEDLIIIGTGPSAKQVYDFLRIHPLYHLLGFAVDRQYRKEETWLGCPVYELETLKEQFDLEAVRIFVSLGWNRLNSERKAVFERLKRSGYRFANLISPTAIVRGNVVGENCWVNDYAVIQSDAEIRDDVVIREFVLVGNGTVIEPHVFLGVRANVCGGCRIGEQTFVGVNGTVFDATVVGKKCIIGSCAAVKRNVPDFTVCKARLDFTETRSYDEDVIESKLVATRNVR